MKTLGERIRYARTKTGLTQGKIAEEFGISRVSVTQWEQDETKPLTDKIPLLAKILQCSPSWLISGDPDESPEYDGVNSSQIAKSYPREIIRQVAIDLWDGGTIAVGRADDSKKDKAIEAFMSYCDDVMAKTTRRTEAIQKLKTGA